MRTITFLNDRGGIGKTKTIYHVSWMLSELDVRTVVVDLDPLSELTRLFLTDDRLEEVYRDNPSKTIKDPALSIINERSQHPVHIEEIEDSLGLLLGDPGLSCFEDMLSEAWFKCLAGDQHSFDIINVFKTIINEAVQRFEAEVVLIDTGSNLGSINKIVVLNSDYIIMPIGYDFFSIHGLKNLGQTLKDWKTQWRQRLAFYSNSMFPFPPRKADPVGYIVNQYSARGSLLVRPDIEWSIKIPDRFRKFVYSGYEDELNQIDVMSDAYCIGLLKSNTALDFLSKDTHKPNFLLRPADGVSGPHMHAVQGSYQEYKALTQRILERCP